ncbi:hypothetical protein L3Q82_013720, partial [Scortum barcoo]
ESLSKKQGDGAHLQGQSQPMRTIAVLGGGIGGLAASYYLCKSPRVTKVLVLESSSRFGGWLWSTRRSDGAVFEHGPRGIRPAGAVGRNTLNMVDDLGLGGEILPVTYSHVASKNRYLYVNRQLHRMPSGLSGVLRTVPPFSRPLLLSVAMEILVKKGKEEDESIHSFVSRRLGKELADIAVDSLCRGVFAGDCRKLSVRSCFPLFYNAEQRRGSLVLGMLLGSGPTPVVPAGPLAQRSVQESWAQWSLSRGVESIPESITEYLQQSERVQLHKETAVKQINPSASGWKIHLEDGVLSADHIISALPAKGKWNMILSEKSLSSALPSSCQPLIQQLQDISTVTVAVVNLEYEGSVLPVMSDSSLLAIRPTHSCVIRELHDDLRQLGCIAEQSCVSRVNRRGLSTQPWGEPVLRLMEEEETRRGSSQTAVCLSESPEPSYTGWSSVRVFDVDAVLDVGHDLAYRGEGYRLIVIQACHCGRFGDGDDRGGLQAGGDRCLLERGAEDVRQHLGELGFGHLVPSSEDRGLLGVVYDSVPFPQHNRPNGQTTRLTEAVTEDQLLARATEAVRCQLGVTTAPSWSRVALQRDCIPQYHQGHFRRVESMRSFIRKNNLTLSLIGSSYDGVSVNDVIFSGRTAVDELLGTGV